MSRFPKSPTHLRRQARLAGLTGLLCLAAAGTAFATYQLGDPVDDFTLSGLFGTPTSLSDFAGDIIVINFFATWCPGCNLEAATLENDIHLAYREFGVTVLAIDMQEQAAVVRGWAAARGITCHVLMSPDWDVFARFPRAGGLPYSAVIDRP